MFLLGVEVDGSWVGESGVCCEEFSIGVLVIDVGSRLVRCWFSVSWCFL